MDEEITNIENIAHRLLADKSIDLFSKDLFIVNECKFDNNVDSLLYKFEIIQDISMEILHQYLFFIRLMKNEEEGLNDSDDSITVPNNIELMNGEIIEKLLQSKLKKLNILPFIHKIPSDTNGYYTRIIFYDTSTTYQKNYFKEKKYHYLQNNNWDNYICNIKNIEDIFSVFTINEQLYLLKFSLINNKENCK
jgi:hypothetical protein